MSWLTKLGFKRKPGTVVLEQRTLEPVADLEPGGWRGDVVTDGASVWVLTPEEDTVTRFDAAGVSETARWDLGSQPYGLLLDERGLLVVMEDCAVRRLDPATGAERQRGQLPRGTDNLVSADGLLWGLRTHGEDPTKGVHVSAVQVDPSTLRPMREVELGFSRFAGAPVLAEGRFAVVTETEPGSMGEAVLDARTGERLAADQAPRRLRALAEQDGSLWRLKDRELRRLDATSEQVQARYEIPGRQGGPAVLAGGKIWVISHRMPRSGVSEDID